MNDLDSHNDPRPFEHLIQYRVLDAALYLGWKFAVLLAIVCIFLFDAPLNRSYGILFGVQAVWFFLLSHAMKYVEYKKQAEMLAMAFLIAPVVCTCYCLFLVDQEIVNPLMVAILLFGSFLVFSDFAFLGFLSASLIAFFVCAEYGNSQRTSEDYIQFFGIVPAFALFGRMAINRSHQSLAEKQVHEKRLRRELERSAKQLTSIHHEKQQSDTTVRTQEIQLEAIVEHAPLALCVWDTSGHCTEARGSALLELGLEAGNGVQFREQFRDSPEMLTAFDAAINGDPQCTPLKMSASQHFDVRLSPVYDALGNVNAVAMLCVDVSLAINRETFRRLDEQQQSHSLRMESLGSVAGGVAHDFNNYLMAIVAFSESASANLDDVSSLDEVAIEKVRMASEGIRKTALSASQVCQRMLMAAGKSREPKSLYCVNSILEESESMLRASLPPTAVFRIELAEETMWVEADELLLQRAFVNVIKNAGDALDPARQGEIVVETMRRTFSENIFPSGSVFGKVQIGRPYCCIRIRDNGQGMDKETVKRIFDPYFSTKPTGHGFGLAITNGVLTSHKGFIHCKSVLGEGTTFDLLLPIVENQAESKTKMTSESAASNQSRRLLIIDDEVSVRESVQLVLESLGYEVVVACSGATGLAELGSRDRFDCVVLDFSMPGMNGMEVLEEIRKSGNEVPVILCSGYMVEKDDAGYQPNEYLTKPYQIAELQSAIDRVCDAPPLPRKAR